MDSKPPAEPEDHSPRPAADGAPASQADAAPAAEVAPAQSELLALRGEVAELRDQNLRLLAEQRNQQQRLERDKAEALKYAEADFARALLVILDDLERTQASARGGVDVAAVADGVRIIYEHFLQVLKTRGIEPIVALGQRFDPDLHEALMQQPSDEHPSGVVIQELARGYKMHDRVLRPSRVIVSSGPPGSEVPADKQNQQTTQESPDANL